jgi:GTP cyclohydrolase I
MIDQERIARAVREILEAVGEDPQREALVDTPKRVAATYAELFSGLESDPREELSVTFEEGHEELVIVKDLPFSSLCEHHLLPFMGVAHIGYIPRGRVVGVSKLAKAVQVLAKRPQIQERLTNQAADLIYETLKPRGVATVFRAEHLCMSIRGVRSPGTTVVTSAHRGIFETDADSRSEFLALVGRD